MTVVKRSYLLAVLLLKFVSVSLTCTCQSKHPQTTICQSEWAFLGTMQGSQNFTGDNGKVQHKYEIYIHKVIKDIKSTLKNKAITVVITPSLLDDCAVHLQKDVKAVFTGSFDGFNAPTMNKCDWHEEYSKVPRCQRRNLFRKFYEANCGCTVCQPGECPTDATPHCVWRTDGSCEHKHSHCAMYPGCNKCSWRRCVSFYECEDESDTS
ncbi:metalloproteinase inhibitor 1-like isoform X2 [Ostrea edulis]|uniref:metalloproteinase inhibitor 1-like isoform X2 n=1 Tax=Ostrea edulis TaxID=37623 RepID=UPI002094214B|nr:metalloproteinase inhibitor 1-like isoform X2 [Ostrea edulis]